MGDGVLVIGAGPSGLFVTAELARHGVRARLVERDLAPHHQARATSLKPGTLEILESVGLVDPILAAALALREVKMYDDDLAELGTLAFAGLDCRYDFEASLPQYETERVLHDHLVALGGRVERGVTASAVEPDGDTVHVELTHADGRVETVTPDVVIGADGAHSVTRHSMDEPLAGTTYQGHFLAADIVMDTPFPPEHAQLVFGPDGMILLAPLPGGHFITFQDLEEDVESVTVDEVASRTEARLGGRCRPSEVAWVSPFRMHRRIVSRLSDRRRFLVGDAAHASSPFAGEGMNSGLQDGYDLAWKLALVVQGRAPASLLDDYHVERQIADQHVIDVSDRSHRSIADIADTIRRGDRVPEAGVDPVAAALARDASAMIDIDYAGSPLVMDLDGGDTRGPRPGQRYPDWVRFAGTTHHLLVFDEVADPEALEAMQGRWSDMVEVVRDPDVDAARAGVPEGGMVLVRPDGHIGFRSTSRTAQALAVLDGHLSSYLLAPT